MGVVQMVTSTQLIAVGVGSMPVEMGARGEAVELLGIHTSITQVFDISGFYLATALSSNPAWYPTPPIVTTQGLLEDKSVYGVGVILGQTITTVGAKAFTLPIIPLYGIVRPRRQILVWSFQLSGGPVTFRVEIYYRPVKLGKEDLDSLNLKYGKYRRS